MNQNRNAFWNGVRDGIPIALGYFAVAFSLGIVAKKAGLNPVQGFLSSFLNHASAGEYAEFTVIMADAPYFEMAFVILITNMRYLLMSCALSQKFHPGTSIVHRFFTGFGITDEIFGISIARAGVLNPYYNYGAMAIALPGWSMGTALGIVAGNVLPASAVSALSVALYGMFIAIIVPAMKADSRIFKMAALAVLLSCCMHYLPVLSKVSEGFSIIICAVAASAIGAAIAPMDGAADL